MSLKLERRRKIFDGEHRKKKRMGNHKEGNEQEEEKENSEEGTNGRTVGEIEGSLDEH